MTYIRNEPQEGHQFGTMAATGNRSKSVFPNLNIDSRTIRGWQVRLLIPDL